MVFKNSFLFLKKKIRSLYLNSNIYNKKISSFDDCFLEYKPSPSLLDCLIKYGKKKIKIENYILSEIWDGESFVNTGSGKFKVCEGCSGEGISSVARTTR